MQIFLTSSASQVMDDIMPLIDKKDGKQKVTFITTAGNPYGADKPWLEADRLKLVELGMEVIDFDIERKTVNEIRKILIDSDIVFVAGGNTFYLLKHVKKSGFDKVAVELVKKGLIYIGSSAGSYIACPTIEAAKWKHLGDPNIAKLKDLKALGLVNFIITAHFEPKYRQDVINGAKTTKYPVVAITNDQAIEIKDGKITKIGNGDLFCLNGFKI